MQLNIQTLYGHWTEGYALDLHTINSKPIIYTDSVMKDYTEGSLDPDISALIENQLEYGKILIENTILGWDTKRTEIGEHLYQLKYCSDKSRINIIASEAENFISTKANWQLHKIIPVPPSASARDWEPVYELAKVIGELCKLEVNFTTLRKIKSTSQLKTIDNAEQRREILKDAFDITPDILAGNNILLFDDLFRSGESLNAVCDIVKNKGKAANVYVLTITKTRSKK